MIKMITKFLLLIFCLVSTVVKAQNTISPINITMPNYLPNNIADWDNITPPIIIVAQAKLENEKIPAIVNECKMLVTIKSGGSIICGKNTPQTASMAGFNATTKTWAGATITNLLGQNCILKAGNYELCVQFYGQSIASTSILLGESCKSFTVKDKEVNNFDPPKNISPVNEKKFTDVETKVPITFRWTIPLPIPTTPITYRLKVWQLMQGQNGAAAIKTNQPIIDENIKDQTQFLYKKGWNGIITTTTKASFIWAVEVINSQGNKLTSSEPTVFNIGDNPPSGGRLAGPVTKLNLLVPDNGNIFSKEEIGLPIYLSWTAYGKDEPSLKYKIKVWKVGAPESSAKILFSTINFVTVSGLDFSECYPDSKCHYKWQVQALNSFDDIIGGSTGTSEEFIFTYDGIPGTTKPAVAAPCSTTSTKAYHTADVISLSNNFKLKLTEEPTGNNDSLVGKGTVDVKWIGVLNVQFKGIKINCADKLDTGTVYTVNDSKQEYPTQWAINVLNNTGIPNWTTDKIKNLAAGIDTNKIFKPLIQAANDITTPASAPLNMPLGYFKSGDDAYGSLGFTEMVFKPTKAEFEVIAALRTSKVFKQPSSGPFINTDAIALQGKGIQFTDEGLNKINGRN